MCRGRTPVHTQEVSRDHDEELGICSKNKGRPGQDFKAQVGCGSVYTFFKDVSGCSVETEPGAAGAEVGQRLEGMAASQASDGVASRGGGWLCLQDAGVRHTPRGGASPGSPERKSRTCWMSSRVRLTSSSIWERLALTWVSRRCASDCTCEAASSASLICRHTL